jgi:hypothetical protein
MRPDTVTLTGTMSANTTANTVTGTGTIFDQQLLENDFININGESKQVKKIISPTTLELQSPLASNLVSGTATVTGISDVWNDRFLKKYATALIKLQWGNNLSKFSGVQMPGGVTLDGVRIAEEARTEIKEVEEDLYQFNSLPSEIITG